MRSKGSDCSGGHDIDGADLGNQKIIILRATKKKDDDKKEEEET